MMENYTPWVDYNEFTKTFTLLPYPDDEKKVAFSFVDDIKIFQPEPRTTPFQNKFRVMTKKCRSVC